MIDKVNKEEFRDFALDYIKYFDAIPLEFEDSSGIVIKASVCWQLAIELKLINKLLNNGYHEPDRKRTTYSRGISNNQSENQINKEEIRRM